MLKILSLFLAVFVTALWPVVMLAQDNKQDEKHLAEVKQAGENFVRAVVTRDLEGVMKVVDVPWFDNVEDRPRVITDPAKLKDALKMLSDNFKGSPRQVRLEVLDEFAYDDVQARWPPEERDLLDAVLKKTDRILSARAEVDEEKGNRILIMVSLRGGQYKVVGTKNP